MLANDFNTRDFNFRPAHYALELVDDCSVSAEALLAQCLTYMSDDEIRQMLDANELSPRHMNDDDESMDGDHETALESVYGPNEDWREHDAPDDCEEL